MTYEERKALEAVGEGLQAVAHQISGLHTGNPGDNSLLDGLARIAASNHDIAEAIREFTKAVKEMA
jgi:Flp pilus assembly protein TadD